MLFFHLDNNADWQCCEESTLPFANSVIAYNGTAQITGESHSKEARGRQARGTGVDCWKFGGGNLMQAS